MHQDNETTKPEETQPAESAASGQNEEIASKEGNDENGASVNDQITDAVEAEASGMENEAAAVETATVDSASVEPAAEETATEDTTSGDADAVDGESPAEESQASDSEQTDEQGEEQTSATSAEAQPEDQNESPAPENTATAAEGEAPAAEEATEATATEPAPAADAEVEAEEPAAAVTETEAAEEPTPAVAEDASDSEPEAGTDSSAAAPEPAAVAESAEAETTADAGDSAPAAAKTAADQEAEEGEDYNPAAAQNVVVDEDDEMDAESFEALLEQYDQQFREFRPGDLVEGTIVSLGEQEVLLDIGARVEGTIPASELKGEDSEFTVTDGDKIKVMVCRFNPDAQYIPLSFERARVSQVWDHIEEVASKEKMLKGTVIEKVKGGFIVDVGVRAFLPTSQASLRPQKDMQDLLGQEMEFTILKIQRRRGNLILSRREILEEEMKQLRGELFEKLQEGAVLNGSVKNITDYGVFIDLGGLDGLLHITDMSWGRVNHPKDLVELGQELEVKVLRFDREKEKVSLGLKQCTPDPWLSASENYPPGTNAKGKVLNLTSYGAFIELEPGVEGMIHVSEMSWTKKIRNPSQILTKAQEVECRVLDIDTENRRVSLSLQQCEDNPWESLAERFPVGSRVTGKVRNITEFGAFVEIEDGIDGLVHVSDFAWGERNANPTDHVKKGDEVEVVILAVDTDNHKVSLGMKQLTPDPWIDFTNHYHTDMVVNVPVSKVTEFGVFLRLTDHVEGLIRNNELNLEHGKKASDAFEEDQVVQALITRINNRERKVDLSVRRLAHHQERQAVREYTKNNDTGGATLGDIADLKKLIR